MAVGSIRPTPPKNADLQRLTQTSDKLSPSASQNGSIDDEYPDLVSISRQARSLHNTDKAVRGALDAIPDIRKQKLAEVLKNVNSGKYFSDESIGKSVDALLDDKLSQTQREKHLADIIIDKADKEPDVRNEMVAMAARRKAEKFYETDSVVKKTVDKLWIPPLDRI